MLFQKWWLIRSVLKHSSFILSFLERSGIEKFGDNPPAHPCVFIIGAPRTGSTILYQLVTNLLDVSYIDNLANLARYNPYSGMWLSRLVYNDKPHDSYTSRFGHTTREGLHAPAEGLFCYRWFPGDRHYTEPSDLQGSQIDEFRRTIHAIINRYGKALVIKNLSFSLRLQVLNEALPDAKYVIIRRNPLYTAQSLLQARRENNTPDGRLWGILPRDFRQLEGLDPCEMVVRQIYLIEKQICQDVKKIPPPNVLKVDYEKLGSNPGALMDQVKSFMGPGIRRRPMARTPEISIRNKVSIPHHEIETLKQYILQMDWETFKTSINGRIR